MKKILLISSSIILSIIILCSTEVSAEHKFSTSIFELAGKKYEIKLPSDWSIKQDDYDITAFEAKFISKNVVMGGIILQDHLPANCEVLSSEDIVSNLGSGKLYTLNRSTKPGAETQRSWFEVAALITNNDNRMAYYIYLNSIGANVKRDSKLLNEIVTSFQYSKTQFP